MNLTPILISLPRPPRTLGWVPRVSQPSPLQSGQLIISYQWASRHLQSSLVCLFSPSLGLGGKRNGKQGEGGEGGTLAIGCPAVMSPKGWVVGKQTSPSLHYSHLQGGGNLETPTSPLPEPRPPPQPWFKNLHTTPIRILSTPPPSSLGSWTQHSPRDSQDNLEHCLPGNLDSNSSSGIPGYGNFSSHRASLGFNFFVFEMEVVRMLTS